MPSCIDELMVKRIHRAVVSGGGQWLGIQEIIEGDPLVMFNSPTTGSTLAVPFNPATFTDADFSTAVHKRIADSDKKFAEAKVTVPRALLLEAADVLEKVSGALRQGAKRKKS